MRISRILCCFYLALLLLPLQVHAVQVSRPLPVDSRLRVITYHPDGIHKYTGFYEYQASILFGEGEEIQTISMGYPNGWQMTPSGRRLFLRPIADDINDATTNMLLITNRRKYHFILEAAEVDEEYGMNDPNLVWETTFVYPEDNSGIIQESLKSGPDLSDLTKYNFNYTISGSSYVAPLRIFDDKEFTYFQFEDINAELPAFFLVDSEGREALINYRMEGDYVVIERVTSRFTLRHGPDVVCVFNETMEHRTKVEDPTVFEEVTDSLGL
tara:strand:+ start:618 stop:1427 length:810 start_codon:yes stop_codon:yes gene_type:complete